MEPHGKKILVVEDDPMLHGVLNDSLGREGYQLMGANDGEAGLKTARAERPDLLVLDVILPKMTGVELLEELRKDPNFQAKVLLLTNETEMGTIPDTIPQGSYAYLIKSESNMETIIAKVKELIG